MVRWGVTLDKLVLLPAVHEGYGAGQCGVDVLLGGGGGGGVAAWSGSFRWCSAFWSAVDAGDMERGGMGWSGSCSSLGCWWACGRGAVGVGWPEGRCSRCPSSGLQRTSCRGKRWGGVAAVLRSGVR